jgi:hypothetical protein
MVKKKTGKVKKAGQKREHVQRKKKGIFFGGFLLVLSTIADWSGMNQTRERERDRGASDI